MLPWFVGQNFKNTAYHCTPQGAKTNTPTVAIMDTSTTAFANVHKTHMYIGNLLPWLLGHSVISRAYWNCILLGARISTTNSYQSTLHMYM